MKKKFNVEWFSKDYINAIAEKFLEEHNSSGLIPVNIEKIIENLDIDIIPIPGLKDNFELAGFDIDAFISSDLKSITVDQYIMEKRANRYRFTLAHEISHKLLHEELYKQLNFNSIDDWISIITDIQSVFGPERDKAEWQADELAGRLLVPKKELENLFKQEQDSTFQKYSKNHPDFLTYSDNIEYLDFIMSIVTHSLAQKFEVSDDVIRIRLENENLIEHFK